MKSEKTIEAVVNHQFQSTNLAMRTNNSVELSGFGKFFFNGKKAKKKLDSLCDRKVYIEEALKDELLTEQRRKRYDTMLQNVILDIEFLKSKTNEFQSNLRGMEEQVDSSLGHETTD
jgi:dephospho-CoA kinase